MNLNAVLFDSKFKNFVSLDISDVLPPVKFLVAVTVIGIKLLLIS